MSDAALRRGPQPRAGEANASRRLVECKSETYRLCSTLHSEREEVLGLAGFGGAPLVKTEAAGDDDARRIRYARRDDNAQAPEIGFGRNNIVRSRDRNVAKVDLRFKSRPPGVPQPPYT